MQMKDYHNTILLINTQASNIVIGDSKICCSFFEEEEEDEEADGAVFWPRE